MFIYVEWWWWPAGGYLYRQEGSGLSLAHTSSQPYISPWIKFPREYSIQTFSSNVKSNPNISSVLPKLGMKGFIQSSWAAGARGTVYTTCGNARYMLHAVMLPATTYIIARPPSQYVDMLPWLRIRSNRSPLKAVPLFHLSLQSIHSWDRLFSHINTFIPVNRTSVFKLCSMKW